MSEFQKPYSSRVSDDTYRRIFNPYPSCDRCVESWRSKGTEPCVKCRRDPAYLHGNIDINIQREDFYINQKTAIRKVTTPECCDETKQDLKDWRDCGFKFCPWCGRKL